MAHFVIKGEHTERGDEEALCTRCSHAQIVQGVSKSQRYVACEAQWHMPKVITWHVTRCNQFEDRTVPSLASYEKIAWHISADIQKQKVGFLSPSEYRKKVKAEGDETEPLVAPWDE